MRHFHRCYLKANKVSKNKEARKLEYADGIYQKLSKLANACRN